MFITFYKMDKIGPHRKSVIPIHTLLNLFIQPLPGLVKQKHGFAVYCLTNPVQDIGPRLN
jgi:hypothetical protein